MSECKTELRTLYSPVGCVTGSVNLQMSLHLVTYISPELFYSSANKYFCMMIERDNLLLFLTFSYSSHGIHKKFGNCMQAKCGLWARVCGMLSSAKWTFISWLQLKEGYDVIHDIFYQIHYQTIVTVT